MQESQQTKTDDNEIMRTNKFLMEKIDIQKKEFEAEIKKLKEVSRQEQLSLNQKILVLNQQVIKLQENIIDKSDKLDKLQDRFIDLKNSINDSGAFYTPKN